MSVYDNQFMTISEIATSKLYDNNQTKQKVYEGTVVCLYSVCVYRVCVQCLCVHCLWVQCRHVHCLCIQCMCVQCLCVYCLLVSVTHIATLPADYNRSTLKQYRLKPKQNKVNVLVRLSVSTHTLISVGFVRACPGKFAVLEHSLS